MNESAPSMACKQEPENIAAQVEGEPNRLTRSSGIQCEKQTCERVNTHRVALNPSDPKNPYQVGVASQ